MYYSAAVNPCGDAALQIPPSSPLDAVSPPPGSICQDGSSSERRQWVGTGRITRRINARGGGPRDVCNHRTTLGQGECNPSSAAAVLERAGRSAARFSFIPPAFSCSLSPHPGCSLAFSKDDCHRLSLGLIKGTVQDTKHGQCL